MNAGIQYYMIRLSLGIENAEDLDQAFFLSL